ncbi:DUF5994 family protein [Lentzea sp. NEAU-D7]|uniref:DUF5994 family protein n=1 Tax=Lentzea sp. NEAU-D7 TaxID=2994667 RepID=UPI00224A9202|nr:DUF5994 family protein [Lentzea sp. NEAU-D7]MCX2946953.1 DUF5994 family protein [Lentzea sp. NEAU-D7]
MTSAPHLSSSPPAATATEQLRTPLRLRLRPNALSAGHVDGAWWPRSRDLAAELPALLAVLAVRLGAIPRVSYNLTEWDSAPRQLALDGVRVRLSGFWSRPAHTVDVVAGDRHRTTLLLVPPDADATAAHDAMMRAAERGNTDTVEVLLRDVAAHESTADARSTCIPEQTFQGVR